MMKVFRAVIVSALLATTIGQQYSLDLDDEFTINWEAQGRDIDMQIVANTTGWVSLGILSDDGTLLDVWWGGVEANSRSYLVDCFAAVIDDVVQPRYPDTVDNLNSQDSSEQNGITTIRFRRRYTTGDITQDVNINTAVNQTLIWAFSNSDMASSPLVKGGIVDVVLHP